MTDIREQAEEAKLWLAAEMQRRASAPPDPLKLALAAKVFDDAKRARERWLTANGGRHGEL